MVEEPIGTGDDNRPELETVLPGVTVLRPKVSSIVDIHKVLERLKIGNIDIAWFYSAAFVDLLPYLKIGTLVYDCMDELSQFKGAPPQLRNQEKLLIEEADFIFTGGKSLFEEKSKFSSNVHCFPSSVDVEHFRKANENIEIPKDIKWIPGLIVGYIGVIDERLDLELLRRTADTRQDISFVMIGPLAKIGHDELPKGKNIHYLGMKTYKELPHYLKAFSIAMMPFALNEATQFISPTKTLEYMAADKAIISTAIKDVVRDFEKGIYIIKDSEEFVETIDDIVKTRNIEQKKVYKKILDQTSWDRTVERMMDLLKTKA